MNGPIFHVTAEERTARYMPTIEQYTALAEAIHDESEICNANYQIFFHACPFREQDIEEAVHVLVALHKADWHLERKPFGTPEIGL